MRLTVPYLDWENFVLDAIAQYCFVDGIYGLNSWLLCKIIIKNIVKIHVNGILFFLENKKIKWKDFYMQPTECSGKYKSKDNDD